MKSVFYTLLAALVFIAGCSKNDTALNAVNNGVGQGGSLARFTIAQNHLYMVDGQNLYTYSLENTAQPMLQSQQQIGFNVETIYPFEDKLFIGSQDAMYVYSLEDPSNPSQLGTASHVRACDPVVADNDIAYVTVRSGSSCGGTINALMVYDVKNIFNPVQLQQINLNNPWGLGMIGNRLYVCDGNAGLYIYDIGDKQQPKFITKTTGETFYDVIVTDNLLIAMVDGGTALYKYDNNDALNLVAKITN